MLVSLTLIAGKVLEHIMLETVSQHIKDKVIGSSQCGFMKGKSCLTNLVTFRDEMPALLNDRRALDDVHLDLSKAFSAVSQNILIDKFDKVWARQVVREVHLGAG